MNQEIAYIPSDSGYKQDNVKALLPRKAPTMPKPTWHPPWKLYRVISGHTGWVRSIDVEPGNQWFCSGAGDRIIKVNYSFSFFKMRVFFYDLLRVDLGFGEW